MPGLVFVSAYQETAQEFESAWWGSCANTFGEEAKQITYAHRMRLANEPHEGKWPCYDLAGRSVVDLGGGPVSLLLKCRNGRALAVVDPCPYPAWVGARYEAAGIAQHQVEAEGWRDAAFRDEAWVYNVLQHVIDPEAVIATARAQAATLRIFEWIEHPASLGHPHVLHAVDLNRWAGGTGQVEHVDENGATGLAYYGVFAL